MREIVWTDERGFKRRSLVRDNDPDHLAPQGIPVNPPDVSEIDWEAVARELNNRFIEARLSTWQDLLESQGVVQQIIMSTLKRPILDLFKLKAAAQKSGGG